MSSSMLASVLVLLLCVGGCSAQYYTAATSASLGFSLPSGAPPIYNIIEPVCLTDYTAVWTKSATAPMWAIGGGSDYVTNNVSSTVYSNNGFQTATSTYPPGAFFPRAGAAAIFYNSSSGALYPPGTVYVWQGLYADDIGLYSATYSTNGFLSGPANFSSVIPPQVLFRPAYAVMPYMNYIIQAGGTDAAAFTGSTFFGTNEVWWSADQGVTWNSQMGGAALYGPFPAFVSGSMVALFDNANVPGGPGTNAYSTIVLIVPASGGSQVYTATGGGQSANSWTQVVSAAPWGVSPDYPGWRKSGSIAVDADNIVWYMGGNTATNDIYMSSTPFTTWTLIVPTTGSGQQPYAASFASCLGVRYTSATQKTLVLYSGQIYTSLTPTSGGQLSMPQPSVYSITFTLTPTSTQGSQTPLTVTIPGTAPSQYYFYIQYNASILLQSLGLPYTVCYSGILNTAAHPGFGDTTPRLPYQQVLGTSNAVRIFSNTSFSQPQTITAVTYPDYNTWFPSNYLFPFSGAKVDFYGMAFLFNAPVLFDSPPPPNNFAPPYGTGTVSQQTYSVIIDYTFQEPLYQWQEGPNPDSAAVGTNFQVSAVSGGSNPLPTCSVGVLPAGSPSTSGAPLPVVTAMASCNPDVNGGMPVGSTNGSCAGVLPVLAINVVGIGFTNPVYVYVYDAASNTGICTLNEGGTTYSSSATTSGLISCFPSFPGNAANNQMPSTPNSWGTIVVQTVAGKSNAFPGMLWSIAITKPPWPPAVYNVSGSSCTAQSSSVQFYYGPYARGCQAGTAFTINGDFFTPGTTAMVGNLACSTNYISTTQLTCVTNQPVTATSSPTTVQVSNSVGVSNLLTFWVTKGTTGAAPSLRQTSGVIAAVTTLAAIVALLL